MSDQSGRVSSWSLTEALAELERTDPAVAAAAESLERAKQKIVEGRQAAPECEHGYHEGRCAIDSCPWSRARKEGRTLSSSVTPSDERGPSCRACHFGHPNECEDPINCNPRTAMPRYRKKPVEIDAFQFTGDFDALDGWLNALGYGEADGPAMHAAEDGTVRITTLEGEMTGSVGDWIIRGVQGEFYPCKSDIFAATYEAVADDPVSEVSDGEAP